MSLALKGEGCVSGGYVGMYLSHFRFFLGGIFLLRKSWNVWSLFVLFSRKKVFSFWSFKGTLVFRDWSCHHCVFQKISPPESPHLFPLFYFSIFSLVLSQHHRDLKCLTCSDNISIMISYLITKITCLIIAMCLHVISWNYIEV